MFSAAAAPLHDTLGCLHEDNRALRAGDWKIVAVGKDSPGELSDLTRDRSESKNVASSNPAKVGVAGTGARALFRPGQRVSVP